MIRYVPVLVLSVFALGAWAQSTSPTPAQPGPPAQNSPPVHQHTAAPNVDVIDGAVHPELIPDSVAFRLYFIALSEKDPTLTEASERQMAFFSTAGLNDADAKVAAAILRTFKQRLDALTDTYNTAVVSTNDSTSDRILFASKREALVQATRDAFNVTLSADGASHLIGRVQREKEKMKASKSEIQQIVALRSKPTGFQLVSMKSPQGGCYGFMDLHYNTYTSYTTNSQGRNLYASTQVDGYTGEGNGSWCYGSVTHQPQLHLKIGTAGGWFYGQSVIPSSQINYGQNVTLLCDVCQPPNSFTVQDGVYCTSLGGLIFSVVNPFLHIEIAYTRAISKGTQSNCYWNQNITQEVCDIAAQPWCTAATSPPDWPVNTVSSQVYPPPPPSWWEAFNICLSYGSPGNLRPWVCGPTGFAVEMYTATPPLANCSSNP